MRHERVGLRSKMREAARGRACVFLCLGAFSPAVVQAHEVLLLQPVEQRAPVHAAVEAGLRRELANASMDVSAVYTEFVDLGFRRPIDRQIFADYLRAKYADVGIDAVIALSDEAVRFVAEHRDVVVDVPLVFTTNDRSAVDTIPKSLAVTVPLRPSRTVELALRLQPDSKHLFVVSNASSEEEADLPELREFIRGYWSGLEVEYLVGLPPDELLERVARLPANSFVLYAPKGQDPASNDLLLIRNGPTTGGSRQCARVWSP